MAKAKKVIKAMVSSNLLITLSSRVDEETMDRLVVEAEQKINDLGVFTTNIDGLEHKVGIRLHTIKVTRSF